MRAVVQRVGQASVVVDRRVVGAINEPGLLVFVGAAAEDTPQTEAKMAAKLWGLRILRDELSCSGHRRGNSPGRCRAVAKACWLPK